MLRRVLLLIVAALGLLVLQQTAAQAADFTVTSNGDQPDAVLNGVCATAGGGCTLRAAVQEAENTSEPDTVRVPATTITLSSTIQFTKSTTVIGAGARSTIITGPPNAVLFKVMGLQQEFRDLGFQGAGFAVQQSATAVTTLNRVRVTQHSFTTISTAYGPVYAYAGDMIIRDSEISGNTATSTSSNALGGGVFAQGASTKLTIINSTIAGNTARAGGVGGSSFGGGVYAFGATVSIQASTLIGNSAANSSSVAGYGGNLYSNNSASITNSILAGGLTASNNGRNCWGGPHAFAGRSIIGDDSCGVANPNRQIAADPKLTALADNGGPTNTALPAMDSPAVNNAPSCVTPADQRGQQRPIGSACDIGAAEIGADLRSTQTISNATPSPGSDVALTVTFTNTGLDDAPDTTATIAIPAATSIVSITPTQGTCSAAGTSVTCTLGTFKLTQPVTVIVLARTPQSGALTSTATVSSPLVDPAPDNNTSSVSATVQANQPGGQGTDLPGACSNVINGTSKKDRLTGTANGDRIRGRAGADRIKGLAGADCLYGDGGNDRIVGGSDGDRLFGGPGKDVIKAKDDVRDLVKCGAGRDTVVADRLDKIAKDCERVRRP